MRLTLATLIVPAIAFSACDDVSLSCSNPLVLQKAIESSMDYFVTQAFEQSHSNFFIAQGKMNLQEVSIRTKEKNALTCDAKLYVKIDPKIDRSAYPDLKEEYIFSVFYSVENKEFHTDYVVSMLSVR